MEHTMEWAMERMTRIRIRRMKYVLKHILKRVGW